MCDTRYLMLFQVQSVQHVYPPQVQYVEGGDAVYTNGALYVGFPSPRKGPPGGHAWALSRTFPQDSPLHHLSHLGLCVQKLLLLLWVVLELSQQSQDFRALWRISEISRPL